MNFVPLEIEGVLGIIENSHEDRRGTFTRVWDSNSALQSFKINQSSVSTNPVAGTLRGIHYQEPPYSENKLIQCISGAVFDVVVDLRQNSSSYGKHLGMELGPSTTYLGLFVPEGCAHGYLTLTPNATVLYFMDAPFSPENAKGLLWDDPKLGINWPTRPKLISDQDSSWPRKL
jgi:dTDP-4-dehydrorhamnose 3,5-epimerase